MGMNGLGFSMILRCSTRVEHRIGKLNPNPFIPMTKMTQILEEREKLYKCYEFPSFLLTFIFWWILESRHTPWWNFSVWKKLWATLVCSISLRRSRVVDHKNIIYSTLNPILSSLACQFGAQLAQLRHFSTSHLNPAVPTAKLSQIVKFVRKSTHPMNFMSFWALLFFGAFWNQDIPLGEIFQFEKNCELTSCVVHRCKGIV